jgi:site-specific recombinase XerD
MYKMRTNFTHGGNVMERVQDACASIARILKERGFRKSTVEKYWRRWNSLPEYLSTKKLKTYDAKTGLNYLSDIHGITVFKELGREDKWTAGSIQHLNDYLSMGVIYPSTPPVSTVNSLRRLGKDLETFKNYQVERHMISRKTFGSYDKYIGKFLLYLEGKKVDRLYDIEKPHIVDFCRMAAKQNEGTAHNMPCTLRVFLRYLHRNGTHREDFSLYVPSFTHKRASKLPSVLTEEEKEAIIKCIDRASAIGKRDYAIILTAMRLGLRSADIRGLKFSDIHWERNTIEIVTRKTKSALTLPLPEDAGGAFIDYLKNGRPNTGSPVIFQTHTAPTAPLSAPAVSCIVKRYARKAGINTSPERRLGPHIMRNTLASALLEANVPLPEISGILGHAETRTTQNYYLRIGIKQLRQCALETPPFSWEPEEVF